LSPLARSDVGHRVVVRHRLPDSQLTDVVGVLASWDDGGLAVRRSDGTVASVRPDAVLAARRVPPMPLRRVDLDAVALAAALGRPAVETERLGDWLLRASSGWTGRANSLLPYGDPGVPVDEALRTAERFYAERGLPPQAQVRLGSDAESAIRAAAWVEARPWQADTLVLHTTLDLVNAEPSVPVDVTDAPGPDWYAAAFDGGPVPEPAARVLEGAPTVAFGSVRLDGRIVAVGRASMTGHWAGVDTVHVLDSYRRQGLGTAVLRGLARWAGARGGRRTYLEVVSDNGPALAAYTALGYAEAYRYRYLTAPGGRHMA
jgi:N-acetylglutamate synthase